MSVDQYFLQNDFQTKMILQRIFWNLARSIHFIFIMNSDKNEDLEKKKVKLTYISKGFMKYTLRRVFARQDARQAYQYT